MHGWRAKNKGDFIEEEDEDDVEDDEDDKEWEEELDAEEAAEIARYTKILERNFHNYSECEIMLALERINDTFKVCFGVIRFLHDRGSLTESDYSYPNFILTRKILSAQKGKEIVLELIKSGQMSIDKIGAIKTGNQNIQVSNKLAAFQPSGFAYSKFEWPSTKIFYKLSREDTGRLPQNRLVSLNNPLYPSYREAIADFIDLSGDVAYEQRIEIILPEYKARIKKVKMGTDKIIVEAEVLEPIKKEELLLKAYIHNNDGKSRNLEATLNDSDVTIQYFEEPMFIQLSLLASKSGEELDSKYISYYRLEPWQEVDPEAYEIFIERCVQDGENYKVEFKKELSNKHGELLETISSFSNSKGGLILLGVTDNAKVSGAKVGNDVITNIIASNCEPYPNFTVREVKIGGMPITVIEVKEGDNKPYSVKEKGIFLRKNATDRQITRGELDKIVEEKSGSRPIM